KFQNLSSVFEERAGTFSASGNIAYNSGMATDGFLAQRHSNAPLTIGPITIPGPGVSNPGGPTPPPGNEPQEQPDPSTPANPVGTGTGLLGEYFDGTGFNTPGFSRIDGTVNFDWGNATPAAGLGNDTFSIRWRGQVQPRTSGT